MGNEIGNSNSFENMKCIWMASKFVSYKLCDKSFNCEICLFDRAMRNAFEEQDSEILSLVTQDVDSNVLDHKIKCIEKERFDTNLYYLNNSIVLKKIGGNTYFLGFNPVVLHLIDGEMTTGFLEDYKFLYEGDVFLSLSGEWGNVDILAPFNFFFIDRINSNTFGTQQNRWFAIVGIQKNDVLENSISIELLEEQRSMVSGMLTKIRDRYNTIGHSMYDGGEKIKSLGKIIGTDDYLKILNKLTKTNL